MRELINRLEKLEARINPRPQPHFVWRNPGETDQQALERHFGATTPYGAITIFSWLEPEAEQ